VKDSGVGIPAEMLSTVFEMFMQFGRFGKQSQGGLAQVTELCLRIR
jgi:signal transduction histidine kinase